MTKNVIEDMQEKTLPFQNLFRKDTPLFSILRPSLGKMSMISGFEELKSFFRQQDPNTIDLVKRDFPMLKDGIVSGSQDVWTLEFDGEVVFILRNNKVMNRGQLAIILRRTGFAN